MSTITAGASITTLINVFTVAPDRQHELVELLTQATEEVIQHLPGFISANIHASTDGSRVANYAQWESPELYQAMFSNPAAQDHLRKAADLVEGFEPHLYTVESVHQR